MIIHNSIKYVYIFARNIQNIVRQSLCLHVRYEFSGAIELDMHF